MEEEHNTNSYFSNIPKAGTIIKLDSGITLKVIPNLLQIFTGQDSCEGCYFNERVDGKCGIHRINHPDVPTVCAAHFGDVDKQVIYIKEE